MCNTSPTTFYYPFNHVPHTINHIINTILVKVFTKVMTLLSDCLNVSLSMFLVTACCCYFFLIARITFSILLGLARILILKKPFADKAFTAYCDFITTGIIRFQ